MKRPILFFLFAILTPVSLLLPQASRALDFTFFFNPSGIQTMLLNEDGSQLALYEAEWVRPVRSICSACSRMQTATGRPVRTPPLCRRRPALCRALGLLPPIRPAGACAAELGGVQLVRTR